MELNKWKKHYLFTFFCCWLSLLFFWTHLDRSSWYSCRCRLIYGNSSTLFLLMALRRRFSFSKLQKQLFAGKFCFPQTLFSFEIWTVEIGRCLSKLFIPNWKEKRNFNFDFHFTSFLIYFRPTLFWKTSKNGGENVFFRGSSISRFLCSSLFGWIH